MPNDEPDALTARAIATGLAASALLLLGNLTVGLAAGIWDSGQITASLVAFALAQLLPRGAGRFRPLENDAAQMIACSAAAMPAAMGLLGAVPAMQQLGLSLGARALALLLGLGASVALLGSCLAFLLAPRLLDEEELPFPTGLAAAQLVSALHGDDGEARRRTRALLVAFASALVLVWLRDWKPALIPGALVLPAAAAAALFGAAGAPLGVAVSPLLAGVGAVIGLRTGLALALGAAAGWAVWGGRLLASGAVAAPDALGTFLLWPGAALLVGATASELIASLPALWRSLADLRGAARGGRTRLALPALALGLVALTSAHALAAVPWSAGLLALLLCAPLTAMIARAAGQTDIAPVSQAGQLAQAAAGPLSAGAPLANIGAGALVAGAASQASSLLWSMKTGKQLGARTRTQARAALLGVAFGALFSLPAYLLLTRAAPIGSARAPAPNAAEWRAVAEVVTRGASALPPGALTASLACLLLGALLALGARTRFAAWLPAAVPLGIGLLIPPAASLAMLLGGLAAALASRSREARAAPLITSIAAGLIAGESLLSFLLACWSALGFSSAP